MAGVSSRLSMLEMSCWCERSAHVCTSSLPVLLHDAIACMCSHVLGEAHVHQTIPAKSFAHECGSWWLPMLTPQSLRQSCHEIVVVQKNSYLTGLVVFSAELPWRPVVHGNRGGFISERLIPNMSLV